MVCIVKILVKLHEMPLGVKVEMWIGKYVSIKAWSKNLKYVCIKHNMRGDMSPRVEPFVD
jgi:hypothetical protein